MNVTQMQTEVALMLGNMQSTHPWYDKIVGSATLTGYLSRAANKLVRMSVGGNAKNADLFPELRNSWTVGPTVSGTNTVARPADCIVITAINRAESATLPDWNVTQEKPLGNPIDAKDFGLLAKDSNTAGYAKVWARKGKNALVWPTPTASYLDYLRFYGLKSETAIYTGSDVLFIDEQWHDMVVLLCAHLIGKRIAWHDDADMWLASVEQELQQTSDVTALQGDEMEMVVKDAPSSLTVYGE